MPTEAKRRIVYTGVFVDGSQLMVERWVDRYGKEVGMTAATRPSADRGVTWGPPTILEREDGQ